MATLTVRNLEEAVVRRLRIQAAEHGRSAEAEHREILRTALIDGNVRSSVRQQTAGRLAEFRRRTARGASAASAELLEQTRIARMETLTGLEEGA